MSSTIELDPIEDNPSKQRNREHHLENSEENQMTRVEINPPIEEEHEQKGNRIISIDDGTKDGQSAINPAMIEWNQNTFTGNETVSPNSLHPTQQLQKDINTVNEESELPNNRRLIGVGAQDEDNQKPIIEYVNEPLLPLAEACAPLENILYNIFHYVQMALNETPEEPPDGLTIDESAAIRLYTIEWDTPHRSLYSMLNRTLKTASREELRPYFRYMKLFITALVKIPCVSPTTIWRGVKKDFSAQFPKGTLVTWWAFSSCTTELTVLENNMYLGTSGDRTLFSVEAINGRTVRAHSHFVTEDEILLMPGTYMEVESQFSPATDLHIIHLKQLRPPQTLLALPFKGALLYPPVTKKVPWYKKKRTIVEISLLVIACIVGTIVGAVIGSRRPPPPPICIPPNVSIRADYFWSFDCDDAREDLTGLHNGTIVNGADFISPDFSGQGNALQLNGAAMQYIILPQSLNLTLNTSFTVSAWLYLSGYNERTILSDCNDYNPICISFKIALLTLQVDIYNWTSKSLIQSTSTSVQSYICQGCWVYSSFTFDRVTALLVYYFNGLRMYQTYLTFMNFTWTNAIEKKESFIGLSAVNRSLPYSGLIDRLNILYSVKNSSEILNEASLIYEYKMSIDDIQEDSGPNNIPALGHGVYQSLENNRSVIEFNESQSYFLVNGTTLLTSFSYEFSIAFWLRLDMLTTNLNNSAIAIMQMSSEISSVTSESDRCLLGLQVIQPKGQISLMFPSLFRFFRAADSRVLNNTWTHIGVSFRSPDTFYIYQDGDQAVNSNDKRYSTVINENPRLSVSIGSPYLNASASANMPNYEQMKCFSLFQPFNYSRMYGAITDFVFYSRTLSDSEFSILSSRRPMITTTAVPDYYY